MKPVTDLNAILLDGYSFQKQLPGQGLQDVTISIHQVGQLVLSSGRLIACDPLRKPDLRYHFTKSLNPGCYPVVLSVAHFYPFADARFACAMLQIRNEPTVRWEPAVINEQNPQQGFCGYGVDTGTGCFMDLDVTQFLDNLFKEDEIWEEFCEKLIVEQNRNAFGKHRTADWANVQVDKSAEANIIAFRSGWGDGAYPSFWGYDETGNLTSLVTDFELFLL